MKKQCKCGKEVSDDEVVYCWACSTFTHPAYVRSVVNSGRELLKKM